MPNSTTTAARIANCQLIPIPREAAVSEPSTPAAALQRHPLWIITDPHTPQEAAWLVIAWVRRGDELAAAVVAEDQDMASFDPFPLFIKDTDILSTFPEARAPQGPPLDWAITTNGFEDDGALFWVITGWRWAGGRLEPITTLFDADDLDREGLGLPLWSSKYRSDRPADWQEGYPRGWRWVNGQLSPICAVETAASLDAWEARITHFTVIER